MPRLIVSVCALIFLGLLTVNGSVRQSSGATPPLAFDVASVKAINPSGDGGITVSPLRAALVGGCMGVPVIEHQRFIITGATLYQLIAWAYGADCLNLNTHGLLTGGPGWVRSDKFDIQALIPEGSASYTPQQFRYGTAPGLQSMIRTLLVDRFRLALHQETKDASVYVLSVAKGGPKLQRAKDGSCTPVDDLSNLPGPVPQGTSLCGNTLISPKGSILVLETTGATMTQVLRFLGGIVLDRPVVDKTGLTGTFDIRMEFAPDGTRLSQPGGMSSDANASTIFSAMQEQLGLRLESAKGPVEFFVIDHAEKPKEN